MERTPPIFIEFSPIKDETRFFESARFSRATQIEVVIEIVTKIEIESGSESEIEIESESESEIETQICCIQLSIINRKFFFPAYSYLSIFKSVFFINFQVSRL